MSNGKKLRVASVMLAVLVFGVAAFLVSCYPGDPLTVSETDVVTTFYDKNENFATKMTYARPDVVIEIIGDSIDFSGTSNDLTIMNRIDANMAALGYTKVDSSIADVIVGAAVTTSTWVTGGCYGGYWGWYGYPGWGWCYPVAYTYTTGTLIMVMWDRTQATNQNAVWVGGINGLIQGSVSTSRINDGINQAFAQSPYLGDGK